MSGADAALGFGLGTGLGSALGATLLQNMDLRCCLLFLCRGYEV